MRCIILLRIILLAMVFVLLSAHKSGVLAGAVADNLIQYLNDLSELPYDSDNRILSGQFAGYLPGSDNICGGTGEMDYYAPFAISYAEQFGPLNKYHPVIIGIDLGFGLNVTAEDRQKAVDLLNKLHDDDNNIKITVSWHARNPWVIDGSEDPHDGHNLVQSSDDLLYTSGDAHDQFIYDLALCKSFLEGLDSELPVLWRPFHEVNNNCFWWSKFSDGADGYKALWQYVYEELGNLDNLVWVFSVDDNYVFNEDYYPGEDYVDVVGMDNYGDASLNTYDQLLEFNKPIGITEIGGNSPGNPCVDLWDTNLLLKNLLLDKSDYEKIGFFHTWHRPWAMMENITTANELLTNPAIIHLEEKKWSLQFLKGSPVDLEINGPNGLHIDKNTDGITYIEYHSYETTPGDSSAVINILFADTGLYNVQVIPWFSASPSDTYDLYAIYGLDTVLMASEELISDIPNEGYTVSVSDSEEPLVYICGDANGDQSVNIADASYIISMIFFGGGQPDPYIMGDANSDGNVNIADASYIINWIFFGGNPPCEND